MLLDPTYTNPYTEFAPRRALEAVLAAWHGIDCAEYKLANAHRPWGELWEEAQQTIDDGGRYTKIALSDIAARAEGGARANQHMGTLPKLEGRKHIPIPIGLEELVAGLGMGARSGRAEDYTRAELRKLLGFLERDCAALSDDELRAMALDGHLLPQWQGSPSHLELALYRTHRYSNGRHQVSEFRKAMRTPYERLLRSCPNSQGYSDDYKRSTTELRQELMAHHPFVAAFVTSEHEISEIAKRSGMSTMRPETQRNYAGAAADSNIKLKTALELSYGEAFSGFVEQFGGVRKLGNIRSGLTKTSGRSLRGCYAFYDPATGDIHVNAAAAKRILGKNPDPKTIENVVSAIAHELTHAMETRDQGSDRTGMRNEYTPEHTLDEGATEAIARLHTQDLAERMNLWSRERGSLREHADTGSYPREVETTLALVAACCGELDKDKLRAGGYAQPEALSANAQAFLKDLHLRKGPRARIEHITTLLAARVHKPGLTTFREADTRQLLAECKNKKYQWQHQPLSASADPRTHKASTPPAKIGEGLCARLEELGL
jgi:hypothetical protein